MTNENEMMREVQLPFVDQMIDLRGVQLLSKSHEALQSNGLRERNAKSNMGSSIAMNPFTTNNLQT